MIWLKLLHIATIAVWSAGLMVLPGLYLRRASVTGDDLHRLHGLVRFSYVAVISPAAFAAVASGIGLIFLQATFVPWFSLKLALVGALVVGHILNGLVIIRLFDEDRSYPPWRFVLVTALTVGTVVAILVVVLAKPDQSLLLPAAFAEPGALPDLLAPLNPFR